MFPGARNHCASTRQSQLKIQCYYDLLTERIVHFTLASFRQNDQAASPHILSVCRYNDLILRDLGYFVINVFEKLIARGCCFISRLRLNVILSDSTIGEPLQLLDLLRCQSLLDRPVLMGCFRKIAGPPGSSQTP